MINVIGQKVLHRKFGEGIITDISKTENENNFNFLVSFKDRTVEFKFPDAFKAHLTVADSHLQSNVQDVLHSNTQNEIHKILQNERQRLQIIQKAEEKTYDITPKEKELWAELGELRNKESRLDYLLRQCQGIQKDFVEWFLYWGHHSSFFDYHLGYLPGYVKEIEEIIQAEKLNGWQQFVADFSRLKEKYCSCEDKEGGQKNNGYIETFWFFERFLVEYAQLDLDNRTLRKNL